MATWLTGALAFCGGECAAADAGAAAVFLPKVESPAQLLAAERRLEGFRTRIIAMLESPAAILAAPEIARAGKLLAGLAFGSEDYCSQLGIASSSAALDWPAQMLAVAARAPAKPAPAVPCARWPRSAPRRS